MTADEIIASVLKQRSVAGAEFFIAPGVAVLVDEVIRLRNYVVTLESMLETPGDRSKFDTVDALMDDLYEDADTHPITE